MPLSVIAGLPGSGRSRRIDEVLIDAVRDERAALLVVPSAAEAVRARGRLSRIAPVGVRVATLDGMIEAEWTLHGDGRRFVRDLQRDVLASHALRAAGVSERPGRGAVSLLKAIAERYVSATGEPKARAAGLSGRLVAALGAYEESLQRFGLVGPGEAALHVSRSGAPAEVIAAIGFTTLRPVEEAVLSGWADAGAEVFVSLPWSEGSAATLPSAPLIGSLRARGARVVDLGGSCDDRPAELRRVAVDLFSGSPASEGEGSVRLGIAQGGEAEARLATSFVSDLLAAGASPGSIAVAFAAPSRHAGWLHRAFDDAGISAEWDVSSAVNETPFGRALLQLWAFCQKGMKRESLGAFLRSPFSGVRLEDVDRADIAWRRGGVAEGATLLNRAGEARALVEACRNLAGRLIDADVGRKWKELADRLLVNAYPGDTPVPSLEGSLDAAVHREFCSEIEAAVSLGEKVVTADEIFEAFSASEVSALTAALPGAVHVTSIDRVRRATYDHVVIGGLTASEFPRRGDEDRVEGDAVRRALSVLGVVIDPEESARAERLAFYLAVTAPRRSLALVRRESDDEGRVLRESVFWDEFLDLYRTPGCALADGDHPALDALSLAGVDRHSGSDLMDRGALTDERVLAGLASIEAVSPGEIEVYIGCPYRWFVERRLRPNGPDAVLDRMAAGRVAHEALARFYQRWLEGPPRVTDANVDEAVHRAGEYAAEAAVAAPRPSGLEEERLLAETVPAVQGLVARDAAFLPEAAPVHLEWSFGLAGGDEPVDLGGVSVKGRADRIDIGPEGLVVIDYKRTHASSLAEIQRNGLVQLQLYAAAASQRLGAPIAGGLYRSLAAPDDRGFILRGVAGAFQARDMLDRDGIDEVIAGAIAAAREAAEGMRAGRIAPAPLKERCAYCAAAPFCPEAAH
jgi:ATP-dependent helicase/nuclease subunit B